MAIFAFDERLPTSATLVPASQPREICYLFLANRHPLLLMNFYFKRQQSESGLPLAKKIESFKRCFLKYKTAICALRVYNIFGAPHQRNSGIQFKCQFWPLTGEGKSTEIAVSSSWDNICNSSPNLELGRTSKEALCSVGRKIQGRFQH